MGDWQGNGGGRDAHPPTPYPDLRGAGTTARGPSPRPAASGARGSGGRAAAPRGDARARACLASLAGSGGYVLSLSMRRCFELQ